jgi:N-acetylmuramoyl-L-alanine amidase
VIIAELTTYGVKVLTLNKSSFKLNQGHKSFIRTSVLVGALCLLFYVYLCVLQAYTQHPPSANSERTVKAYKKPLSDTERIAECSMSEVCTLLGEVGYFEARNQKTDVAVAGTMFVAINRLDKRKFGATLKDVVYAPWQFSYTHDGSLKRGVRDKKAYKRMLRIAHYVWSGEVGDPTNRADHYHTTKVKPIWSGKLKKTVKLGSHVYYKEG